MTTNGKDGLTGASTSSREEPGVRAGKFAPYANRTLAVAGLAVALSGCAGVFPPSEDQKHLDEASYMVGASPLNTFETFKLTSNGTAASLPAGFKPNVPDYRDLVGLMVIDSQTKCLNFLGEVAVSETTQNSGLDVANTLFGALGTAFTPVSTVHAFTAAGTVVGGWKTALASDVYAKATIANYSQAIQSNYFKDMKAYTDALATMDPTKMVPSIEYTKIQSIHAECSLASAQAAISASLQSGAPAGQSTSQTQTLTFDKGIDANQTLTLVAKSLAFKTGSVSVTVPNTVSSTAIAADDAAADLSDAVNAVPEMSSNKIVATHPTTPGNTVVLSWPSTITVTWTVPSGVTTPAKRGRAAGAKVTSAARAVSIGQESSEPTPTTTSAVVPGHDTHPH